MRKDLRPVKSEASGGQHPKDHHHSLSGLNIGVSTFHHNQLILSVWCRDLEHIQRYIQMDTLKGEPQHYHYQRHDN